MNNGVVLFIVIPLFAVGSLASHIPIRVTDSMFPVIAQFSVAFAEVKKDLFLHCGKENQGFRPRN